MHPRFLVGGEAEAVVELWAACLGEAGADRPAFAGGALEQPALLADAFQVCDAVLGKIRAEEAARSARRLASP